VASKQSSRTPTRPADLNAPFFDVRETAWILKCSFNTVRRLMEEGRLGYSQDKKGGAIRISRQDIDAYYNASRSGPPIPRRRPALSAAA
jgi:excisionase family DNA binding protein